MKENYDIIYNGSSGKGSHQTVWNLFSTVKELNTLGIHNSGYRMLEKRKCADYIPNETITKTDMALMNREAENNKQTHLMNFKRVCLLFLFNLCIFLDQRKYTLYSHNADDRYVRPARQSRYQTKSIHPSSF